MSARPSDHYPQGAVPAEDSNRPGMKLNAQPAIQNEPNAAKQFDDYYPPAGPGPAIATLNAIPLTALNRAAAPVDCPVCRQRVMTRIELESGGFTHLLAAVLCCLACVGCIPYCISSTKNAKHFCPNCNSLLATYHRSGGSAEVHAYGTEK